MGDRSADLEIAAFFATLASDGTRGDIYGGALQEASCGLIQRQ
jgi:hypothetical protein